MPEMFPTHGTRNPWISGYRRTAVRFMQGSMGAVAGLLAGQTAARADDWFQLKTPHFTVISEASEGRTRDWAVEFELFRRGMALVMPVDPAAVEPVTLVLFRSDRRLNPFKPMEDGKPAKVAGYFARTPGRNLIAISIEGARDAVREIIYHEGVHWHLAAAERPRPIWLEEGLAEVFGNFRLSGDSFFIGANRPEFIRYVKLARPMPFAKIMEVDTVAYNGKHADHAALFYFQSWVMVHALMFGTEGVGCTALARFLRDPVHDRNSTRDFEQGFGVTSAAMDKLTAGHVDHGRFFMLKFPFNRVAVEIGFSMTRAPTGEVDLTLGNLLIGAGRAGDAEPYLRRAFAALPDDPRTAEALGGMNLALDRIDDAVVKYTEALRRGSRSYVTHFMLGENAIRQARQIVFGTPDLTAAVPFLLQAVQLNPRFVPALETLALAAPFLPGQAAELETVLGRAAARYPGNTKIQAGVAYFAAKKAAEAAVLRDRIPAQEISPDVKRMATELKPRAHETK